jgi:hypothetical protein
MSIFASELDRTGVKAKRDVWHDELESVDPKHLVFLDESSVNTSMTRRYGRSTRGQRVHPPAPNGAWKTLTLTAAIRVGGLYWPVPSSTVTAGESCSAAANWN